VIQGEHRHDVPLPQALDESSVEVEALPVGGAAPLGLNPRPGDGEAVGSYAQARQEVEILFEAVVVVAGDIAGVAVQNVAGSMREGIPDRGPAPILVNRAFDLVGSGRGAPQETFRKVPRSAYLDLLGPLLGIVVVVENVRQPEDYLIL
jgi:hypothetical protein